MFIGPVFNRELAISPRRVRTYAARSAYALILLGLISIAWTMLTGTQIVRNLGDMARFGAILFQILAPLQLALAMFFSATLVAGAVGQEKDRKTLVLLLLTHLSNSELVLGKLFASLLSVFVLLVAGLPVFMIAAMLGGVSFDQIGRSTAVTAATILACGSLGSTLALWREKTFQSLAMTVLLLVLWLAVWEIVATGTFGNSLAGLPCEAWAAMFSPWQAIVEATRPFPETYPALGAFGSPVIVFVFVAVAISAVLNGTAVALVRVWNPSRAIHIGVGGDEAGHEETTWDMKAAAEKAETASEPTAVTTSARKTTRAVWDNPILWREIRTWAYGRKILIIRLVYLLLFAIAAVSLWSMVQNDTLTKTTAAAVLAPFFFLSLILLNAQAVTALTSERDAKALDLLLVTDLTPKEVVFGKLGGVVYNTKEMFLLPVALCVYLCFAGMLSAENTFYLVVGPDDFELLRRGSRRPLRNHLREFTRRHRHQPGHRLLPVPRRGDLHANDGRLQRLLRSPTGPLPGDYRPRRRRTLRGPRRPQSVPRHRPGLVPLPLRHVLRHHQFPIELHPPRLPRPRLPPTAS